MVLELAKDIQQWWEILYTKQNKRHVERQDTAKLLYSSKFPTRALVDSDGEPLHKYDYYVRLRVDKPWKVPLLYGQLPRAPDSAATANERGTYALLMMVLFRPFRHPRSFVEEIFRGSHVSGTEDAVWDFVYNEYLRWREHDIDAIARRLHAEQQVPLISKDVMLSQDDTSSDALSFRPHFKFLRESKISST